MPLNEVVLPEGRGPGTGTVGLIPAPPSSVAPRGIPTRPTVGVDDDGVGVAVVIVEQLVEEPLDMPPPSNSAPDDAVVVDPGQPGMV